MPAIIDTGRSVGSDFMQRSDTAEAAVMKIKTNGNETNSDCAKPKMVIVPLALVNP